MVLSQYITKMNQVHSENFKIDKSKKLVANKCGHAFYLLQNYILNSNNKYILKPLFRQNVQVFRICFFSWCKITVSPVRSENMEIMVLYKRMLFFPAIEWKPNLCTSIKN